MAEIKRGDGGKFVKKSGGFTGSLEAGATSEPSEPSTNINGATVINPAEIGGAGTANAASESEGKRKPGRPAGYSPKKEEQKTLHIDGLSAILFSMHTMLAGIASVPELMLTEDEAKKMAKASADVAKHYNFNATEKQMSWFNLTLCVGGIYGSKYFAFSARMKEEKKGKTTSKPNGNATPSQNNMPEGATFFGDLNPVASN